MMETKTSSKVELCLQKTKHEEVCFVSTTWHGALVMMICSMWNRDVISISIMIQSEIYPEFYFTMAGNLGDISSRFKIRNLG